MFRVETVEGAGLSADEEKRAVTLYISSFMKRK
jgi:hypothetical protein